MDVICDPIATFATKYRALVWPVLLLSSPTLVMRCPCPETLQPKTESEQLLSCWHIIFCAQGDDPAALHLPPLDAALFGRSFQSPSSAMFSARQTSKEPRSGWPCFFLLSCDFFEPSGPSGSLWLILYVLWPWKTKVSAAGWRCVIKCS